MYSYYTVFAFQSMFEMLQGCEIDYIVIYTYTAG